MRQLLPLLSASLCLASCLELEQRVVVRPDGSGTQTLRLVAGPEVLGALRQLAPGAQAGDPSRLFQEPAVRREVEALGLRLVRHQSRNRDDGRRALDLEVAFDSLDGLRKSPLTGGAATWELGPGPTPGTQTLVCYPRGKAAHEAAADRAKALAVPDERELGFFARRKEQLRGLRVSFELEVPGEVRAVSANLAKSGARAARCVVTEAEVKSPQDLVLLLAPRFEVVFATPPADAAARSGG